LRKLKKNNEAIRVIELCYAKNPKEPVILFDMARIKMLANDKVAGFVFLNRVRQNLNTVFNKPVFLDQLNNPDFDKVRHTKEFKMLIE
jgi:hypothetical protein